MPDAAGPSMAMIIGSSTHNQLQTPDKADRFLDSGRAAGSTVMVFRLLRDLRGLSTELSNFMRVRILRKPWELLKGALPALMNFCGRDMVAALSYAQLHPLHTQFRERSRMRLAGTSNPWAFAARTRARYLSVERTVSTPIV